MEWTPRQAQAIQERDANLLVSAAAGSGKTAVLVERVKRLVLEERIGIDELLVVTFTNAAASEMKEKILKSLGRELLECEGDQEKQQFLRRQLHLVQRANISTFHAFALEIVHRYYHIIGIAPGLSICDEPKQKILKEEALQELMEDCFDREDKDFLDFLDRYCSSKGNEALKDMMMDFHTFMQSLPDADQWFAQARNILFSGDLPLEKKPILLYLSQRIDDGLDTAAAYFRKAADRLLEAKDEAGHAVLDRLAGKVMEDSTAVDSIREVLASGNLKGAMAAIARGFEFSRIAANSSEKPYYSEALKEEFNQYREAGKQRYKKILQWCASCDLDTIQEEFAWIGRTAAVFYRLVRDFDERYAQKKAQQKILDFSDIEHFALRILEDEQVCNEYKERLKYIFIDEYQDSNRVQESLIERICRPDNLFMVGDVKQSIYKFRLAEPELFIHKYFAYKAGDSAGSKVVDLNSNFRSKQGVIEFVNRLFGTIMNQKSTGVEYDSDAALVKGCAYQGSCDHSAELYLVDSGLDEEEEMPDEIAELKAIELEAMQAASILSRNLGQLIHDDEKNLDRPLEYRDMVILLRAVRNNGEIFYKALADADIPVFLDRSEGYFDTIEIQVFLNLLRLIDNKRQDIPLLSVLRSPVFGFSADELAAVRIFSGRQGQAAIPYNEAFKKYSQEGDQEDLRAKCLEFLTRLSFWRRQATFLPLGDFIWELLVSTGYQDFAGAIAGGDQRQANLKALVDKAVEYESRNSKGLFGFITYIEAIAGKRGKIDIGQAKILSEGANAVRIMTIHKSKGLEFPLVLLAGLGKRLHTHHNRMPVAYHKELGFGFRLVDAAKNLRYDTVALKMISDKEKQEELAESIRLLYVALTRPKDRLLLLGSMKEPERALEKAGRILPGDVESAGTYLDMIVPVMRETLPIHFVARKQLELSKARESVDRIKLRKTLEEGFPEPEGAWDFSGEDLRRRLTYVYPSREKSLDKRKYTVSQLAASEKVLSDPFSRVLAVGEEAEYEPENHSFPQAALYGAPKFLSSAPALTAADKGTAYHIVMEHIPFTKEGKKPEEIAAFLEKLAGEKLLSVQEAASVDPQRIASFFTSDIGRRILSAREIHKEAPFVLKTLYNGQEIMVQGTIDCYFTEGDSLVLLDYKSNVVDRDNKAREMERMEQTYRSQMNLYKEALEAILDMQVKESIIYLFGMDEQLSFTY
jgi:ATP-dependent helicase/nuclease subunit A